MQECPSKPPTSERSFTFGSSQFKLPPPSSLRRGEESELTESEDHTPKELDSIEGTSLKQVSTPLRVMTVMPELRTKRCRPSPNDGFTSAKKSKSHPL
ncbi:hypothetical protein MRB53_013201 [Persea americana]|uniref:Uncharacterized protein n=1 Tax=Persea americana TaxID=3435 RepID=A0ACC2K7H2_PERAE|nr:hypothetical protein MRB53_013201 [Persea americana]